MNPGDVTINIFLLVFVPRPNYLQHTKFFNNITTLFKQKKNHSPF